MKPSYATILFGMSALGLGACSWSNFDSLSDQAWAKSVDAPSIGSTTYGAALFNTPNGTDGGRISVISDSAPNYSTLELDPKGGDKLGKNVKLGSQQIDSLASPPVYASNISGDCAVVGTQSDSADAYLGCSSTPTTQIFAGQASKVTSAAYLQRDLVIAAGGVLLISKVNGDKCWCNATDSDTASANAVTPVALVGAGDGSELLAWAADGKLYSYTDLSACEPFSSKPPVANCHAAAAGVATGITPAPGSSAHFPNTFVVLASSSQVGVFDTTLNAMVGSPLAANGVSSVAVGRLGDVSQQFVALAYPDRSPGGGVDLYALGQAGTLLSTPDLTFADEQPDSGELFGRSVAFVDYNGASILAVAAKSEVFLYYRTLLYQDTRQQ